MWTLLSFIWARTLTSYIIKVLGPGAYLSWWRTLTLTLVPVEALTSRTTHGFWTSAFANTTVEYLCRGALYPFVWTETFAVDIIKNLVFGASGEWVRAFTQALVTVEALVSWAA